MIRYRSLSIHIYERAFLRMVAPLTCRQDVGDRCASRGVRPIFVVLVRHGDDQGTEIEDSMVTGKCGINALASLALSALAEPACVPST